MKRATLTATLILALLAGVAEVCASTITFGTVGAGANRFPFGGVAFGFPGTDYQQVYNAALFGALPILITDITFFHSRTEADTFDDGTYTFELSTTAKAVNGLDTTTLGNNVGPDEALFATVLLSGAMGQLTVSGGPFLYNPLAGNLLLQIQNSSPSISTVGFMDAMISGSFGTDSSRAHNYGEGFEGTGLVTQFTFEAASAQPVPEPASLTLLGLGLAGMGARRWRQRNRA